MRWLKTAWEWIKQKWLILLILLGVISVPLIPLGVGSGHLTGNYTVGLVSCWNMSSDASDDYDSNAGSLHGVTFDTSSKAVGLASADFAQESDVIAYDDDSSLDLTAGNFTIGFWIYTDPSTSWSYNNDRVFNKGTDSGGCGGGKRYEMYPASSTSWVFAMDDNSVKFTSSGINIPSNTWTYITYVNRGDRFLGYKDGVLQFNSSETTGDVANSCPLYFNNASSHNGGGIMKLDEFAIWSDWAAKSDEVDELYNGGSGSSCDLIIASGDASGSSFSPTYDEIPTVTQVSPADSASYYTTDTVSLVCNATLTPGAVSDVYSGKDNSGGESISYCFETVNYRADMVAEICTNNNDCILQLVNGTNGSVVTKKTLDYGGNDYCKDIEYTSDGGFMVSGKRNGNSFLIGKIESDLSVGCNYTRGGSGDFFSVEEMSNGNFVAGGENPGGSEAYVGIFDNSCNPLRNKSIDYFSGSQETFYTVSQADNGDLYMMSSVDASDTSVLDRRNRTLSEVVNTSSAGLFNGYSEGFFLNDSYVYTYTHDTHTSDNGVTFAKWNDSTLNQVWNDTFSFGTATMIYRSGLMSDTNYAFVCGRQNQNTKSWVGVVDLSDGELVLNRTWADSVYVDACTEYDEGMVFVTTYNTGTDIRDYAFNATPYWIENITFYNDIGQIYGVKTVKNNTGHANAYEATATYDSLSVKNYNWSCKAETNHDTSATTSNSTFNITTAPNPALVTLLSPSNASIQTSIPITLECNASGTNLVNISLYTNTTITSSGVEGAVWFSYMDSTSVTDEISGNDGTNTGCTTTTHGSDTFIDCSPGDYITLNSSAIDLYQKNFTLCYYQWNLNPTLAFASQGTHQAMNTFPSSDTHRAGGNYYWKDFTTYSTATEDYICTVYNGSGVTGADYVWLYVDGVLKSSSSSAGSGGTTFDMSGDHVIGEQIAGQSNYYFQGRNYGIWNRQLSPTEISTLYSDGGVPALGSGGSFEWGINQTKTCSDDTCQVAFNISPSINNSVLWNCKATESDDDVDWGNANWTVSYNLAPSLSVTVLSPIGDTNMTQNEYSEIRLNVSCSNAYCGDVDVTLDPVADSCEADRSCCDDIGLHGLCWRNDTDRTFSSWDMVNMINRNDNDLNTNGSTLFGNKGSWLRMHRDALSQSNGGTGKFTYGVYDVLFEKVMQTKCSSQQNYEWRPDQYMDYCKGYGTPAQESEMRWSFVDDYTILVEGSLKCTDSDDCDNISEMPYLLTDMSSNAQNLSITCDTVSGYDGFYLTFNATDSNTNRTLKDKWYGAVNITPQQCNTSSDKVALYFNLTYNQVVNFSAILVRSDYYNNISNMLPDADQAFEDYRTEVETFYNGFKLPPSDTTFWQKQRYGGAIYNLMINMQDRLNDTEPSYWRNNTIIRPGASYDGIWIWDSFFASMFLLTGCETNACYNMMDDWINMFTRYQKADGQWPREVWDSKIGYGYQAPGGWPMVMYEKYLRTSDSTSMCNNYDSLKKYDEYLIDQTDGDHDQVFQWSAGDSGWDSSARFDPAGNQEAIDLQGWMILDAYYLEKIANVCSSGDATMWHTRYENRKTNSSELWNESAQMWYDNNENSDVCANDAYGCTISGAIGFVMFANFTDNTSRLDPIKSSLYNTSLMGINTTNDIGAWTTLSRNDHDFDPNHATGNWNGANWVNINLITWMGFVYSGYYNAAAYLRNYTMSELEIGSSGYEAYNSDTGDKTTNGFHGESYVWSDACYVAMLFNDTIMGSNSSTSSSSKGIIPTGSGTPFYTNSSSNPVNVTLSNGESVVVTFWVNATGTVNNTYEFYAYANITSDKSNSNETSHWNVTIISSSSSDLCDYSGSGDFNPPCSCEISTPTNVIGDLILNTTGLFNITSQLNATGYYQEDGCVVYIPDSSSGELYIK